MKIKLLEIKWKETFLKLFLYGTNINSRVRLMKVKFFPQIKHFGFFYSQLSTYTKLSFWQCFSFGVIFKYNILLFSSTQCLYLTYVCWRLFLLTYSFFKDYPQKEWIQSFKYRNYYGNKWFNAASPFLVFLYEKINPVCFLMCNWKIYRRKVIQMRLKITRTKTIKR